MAADLSVAEMLGVGIEALARADAAELESLARAAPRAERPAIAEEVRIARERLRALETLLTLTQRNLRLLRGVGGYGSSRG
jgi:hypothetical protein